MSGGKTETLDKWGSAPIRHQRTICRGTGSAAGWYRFHSMGRSWMGQSPYPGLTGLNPLSVPLDIINPDKELKLIRRCRMTDDWIITLLGGGFGCRKCSLIADRG